MTTMTYKLSSTELFTSGLPDFSRLLILRDNDLMGFNEHAHHSDSGAYFSQLAVWLDEVCMKLGKSNYQEIAKLQRVIDDLQYLFEKYEIKKKKRII